MLLAQMAAADAADVKLIAAIPVSGVMKDLGAQFERASGRKLVIQYEVSGVLKRKIDGGESFDAVMTIAPVIDELAKEGKVVAATRVDVAHSGVGLAVQRGAPKPDIGSVEAFRRTLLNAKSVAHSREGATGVYFKELLERLGIAGEMQPRLKPLAGEALLQAVPRGEAEMIVVTISGIMDSGAELVGPLPTELQSYISFAAGVGTAAKEPDGARELLQFLKSPAAAPSIKARGMEPGAPR
jgi:molybdate transport system substrate-binding protein